MPDKDRNPQSLLDAAKRRVSEGMRAQIDALNRRIAEDTEAALRRCAEGENPLQLIRRYANLTRAKDVDRQLLAAEIAKQMRVGNHAAPASSPENNQVGAVASREGLCTHIEVAKEIGIRSEIVRLRLERWRKKNLEGYHEVENPGKNETKYVYERNAIKPVIDALLAKYHRTPCVRQEKTASAK